ncbi:MAG: UPF0104 family protein [Lysobacter sp.]|nr:UPF0104 family protein [Lysobacter sp.]
MGRPAARAHAALRAGARPGGRALRQGRMKPHHPTLRLAARIASLLFLLAVAVLLVHAARTVDWTQVRAAIAGYAPHRLALAGVLTAASYALYCGYDVAARRYAEHDLRHRHILPIVFVSYALSMNIGAVLGGAGFRLRLYTRSGLSLGLITRIIFFATVTNWTGYLLLAGVLFARRTLALPPGWRLGVDGLQVLGVAMLGVVAAYLVACRLMHGRIFHVRGHHFRLPSLHLALLQLAMSTGNWMLMAGIVHVLLPGGIAYPEVLAVLLLGAVAAAAVHMPAGIGVLEAVFVALLDGRAPRAEILAAVLTYRAFYYLLPLAVAMVVYAGLEMRRHRQGGRRTMHGDRA